MKIVGRMVLILALFLFWTAGRAEAHAYVDRSQPADGSEYIAAPPEIKVWFTEALETKFSTLTLVDAGGQPVPGTKQTAAADSVLVLQVPPLANGVYTVKWHVLAADTHVTDGTITFGVGVPLKAATSPTPAPVNPAPPTSPGTNKSGTATPAPAPSQPTPAPSQPAPAQAAPTPAPQPSTPAPAPSASSSTPATNPTTSAPAPNQSAAPQSPPTATDTAPAASTDSGAGVSPWILAAAGLIAAASVVLWLRRKRS